MHHVISHSNKTVGVCCGGGGGGGGWVSSYSQFYSRHCGCVADVGTGFSPNNSVSFVIPPLFHTSVHRRGVIDTVTYFCVCVCVCVCVRIQATASASACARVSSLIQHATRRCLPSAASLAPPHFSALSHKRRDFQEHVVGHKMCIFGFCKHLFEKFLIIRRIQRDIVITVKMSSCKVRVILFGF